MLGACREGGNHFQAGIMASEILRSFEEWLDSVTDEELLAALEEVDEELAAVQRATSDRSVNNVRRCRKGVACSAPTEDRTPQRESRQPTSCGRRSEYRPDTEVARLLEGRIA